MVDLARVMPEYVHKRARGGSCTYKEIDISSIPPADRDQRIVALRTSGMSTSDLAAQFGLSRQRIYQIIRRIRTTDKMGADRYQVKEQSEQVAAFLNRYQRVIADLASSGLSRSDIEARFALLLPDISQAVIRESLSRAEVIFNVSIQEHAFPAAAIEFAVWYALARDLKLGADFSVAMNQIDLAKAREVATFLDRQGLEAQTIANILIRIENARAYVAGNPAVSITKKRYEEVRREVLDELDRVFVQGMIPWPPTCQTVMKRLGGNYWAEALKNIGLTPDKRGRERGLLKFTENEYYSAIVDFLDQANATGQIETIDAYGAWVESEGRAGRRRPAAASVRQRYGSWTDAKRIVAGSGTRAAASLDMRRRIVTGRSSVGTLALHKAQEELRRFLAELDRTASSEVSSVVENFIKNYWQEFEYSRREWLRNIVRLDPEIVRQRLQQGGLSRRQRDALEQDPPNIGAALSDMYLDKMLSGTSGPRNTDSWLRSEAQAELDALHDDVVWYVEALHAIRNFLTHGSEEARNRLQIALASLAAEDSHFRLQRGISRRVLLDWLTSDKVQRLRTIAEAIPTAWRAMIVVESILQSSVNDASDGPSQL